MRYRLPAVAVLGVVGRLSVGSALLGVAGTPAKPPDASASANGVLAEATVPPGGQPTAGIHTLEARWLGGSGTTPGTRGVRRAHAFYLYDDPPSTVIRYVERHLTPGAVITGYGTNDRVVTFVTESLPVSVPDEYAASLSYQASATNGTWTHSELRIDAKIVWVIPHPLYERAPTRGIVQVTGFRRLTFLRTPGGPVTVTLPVSRVQTLLRTFDSLPVGPGPSNCAEGLEYFTIAFRPHAGAPASLRLVEGQCPLQVAVTENGRNVAFFSDSRCALLGAVSTVLPDRAVATKRAAAECSRARETKPKRSSPPRT